MAKTQSSFYVAICFGWRGELSIINKIFNGNPSCSMYFLTSWMKHCWNHTVKSMTVIHAFWLCYQKTDFVFSFWGSENFSLGILIIRFAALPNKTRVICPSRLWTLVPTSHFSKNSPVSLLVKTCFGWYSFFFISFFSSSRNSFLIARRNTSSTFFIFLKLCTFLNLCNAYKL